MPDLPDGLLSLEVESALPGIGLRHGEQDTRRWGSVRETSADRKTIVRCGEEIGDATHEGLQSRY